MAISRFFSFISLQLQKEFEHPTGEAELPLLSGKKLFAWEPSPCNVDLD